MISMLHIHRNISQISNEILQWYCGNNFSYVKDSKGLAESLKEQKVVTDETVVSFNCNGLFTSIPVTVALKVINRKFTECIDQRVTDYFLESTCYMSKVILLWKWYSTTVSCPSRKYYTTNSKYLQWVALYLKSLPTFTWNILEKYPKP